VTASRPEGSEEAATERRPDDPGTREPAQREDAAPDDRASGSGREADDDKHPDEHAVGPGGT